MHIKWHIETYPILRSGWHTRQHLWGGNCMGAICGSLRCSKMERRKHSSLFSTFSTSVAMDSSVLPLTAERGYLYIMARHCLPSRPHRPTSCQYEEISCGGPQWITISTFWMSIPIQNATVATMHRNEELLSIACLIIRDWLYGSFFLWNISTNLLWTVLGTPSCAWWASSRFNRAYISLTMLMLLEEWREAGYNNVFKYETLFRLLSLTIITQLQRLSTVRCRYKELNSPKY